jgi:hypothetical protein
MSGDDLAANAEIWSSTTRIRTEISDGRVAAHAKHGENSIEAVPANEFGKWLAILGEEFGEVAHELTYDAGSVDEASQFRAIRSELVDVATVAVAWIAAIDRTSAT